MDLGIRVDRRPDQFLDVIFGGCSPAHQHPSFVFQRITAHFGAAEPLDGDISHLQGSVLGPNHGDVAHFGTPRTGARHGHLVELNIPIILDLHSLARRNRCAADPAQIEILQIHRPSRRQGHAGGRGSATDPHAGHRQVQGGFRLPRITRLVEIRIRNGDIGRA